MNDEAIRFADLSGWLKFAFIWTLISFGASILTILLYAIIGASYLE